MTPQESAAARLRSQIVDIDRQLLAILLAHVPLNPNQLKNVATLEHSRTAAWRLLIAVETPEAKT